MCWDSGASVFFASAGTLGVAYAVRKKISPMLYVPLGYFVLMELLQALTYPVLNSCSLPLNQNLTLLAYVHIAFQPLFFNAIGLYFLEPEYRKRFQTPVFAASCVAVVLMLARIYPFENIATCPIGEIMCGAAYCSVSGSWHMEWQVPMNQLLGDTPIYLLSVVLLPFLYGSWKASLFSLVFGVGLSVAASGTWDEVPAVWCLFSVGLIMIMIFEPLRDRLYVKGWYGQ